jgi:hypothetical protein
LTKPEKSGRVEVETEGKDFRNLGPDKIIIRNFLTVSGNFGSISEQSGNLLNHL